MLVNDKIVDNEKFNLSAKHIKLLDNEREKHVKGKSNSYNWPQTKEIIRAK